LNCFLVLAFLAREAVFLSQGFLFSKKKGFSGSPLFPILFIASFINLITYA